MNQNYSYKTIQNMNQKLFIKYERNNYCNTICNAQSKKSCLRRNMNEDMWTTYEQGMLF